MTPQRIVFIGANFPAHELACPHWLGVQAGLKRLGIPHVFLSCRPSLDIEAVVSFHPDLIVYGLADIIKNTAWRREIRERCPNAVIVLWYGDYRDSRMIVAPQDCSEMDGMFVSNNAQESYYRDLWRMKKVWYLPLGCEPLETPMVNEKFAFDFVFIGGSLFQTLFKERSSFIETLRMEQKLQVINSYEPPMRKKIYLAMPMIYSSSKISLDISHFTNIDHYTSIRYWEIPAMYGFALTKRWPGCEEYYPEDAHAYFDTMEELAEKKAYYLTHEKERLAMRERAHELSKNHSYDKRFLTMFSCL